MTTPIIGAISVQDVVDEFGCDPNFLSMAEATGQATTNIQMTNMRGLESGPQVGDLSGIFNKTIYGPDDIQTISNLSTYAVSNTGITAVNVATVGTDRILIIYRNGAYLQNISVGNFNDVYIISSITDDRVVVHTLNGFYILTRTGSLFTLSQPIVPNISVNRNNSDPSGKYVIGINVGGSPLGSFQISDTSTSIPMTIDEIPSAHRENFKGPNTQNQRNIQVRENHAIMYLYDGLFSTYKRMNGRIYHFERTGAHWNYKSYEDIDINRDTDVTIIGMNEDATIITLAYTGVYNASNRQILYTISRNGTSYTHEPIFTITSHDVDQFMSCDDNCTRAIGRIERSHSLRPSIAPPVFIRNGTTWAFDKQLSGKAYLTDSIYQYDSTPALSHDGGTVASFGNRKSTPPNPFVDLYD